MSIEKLEQKIHDKRRFIKDQQSDLAFLQKNVQDVEADLDTAWNELEELERKLEEARELV